MAVFPIAMRGREDSAELEYGDDGDPAYALRASSGGSSKPMVAITCVTGDRTHALTSEGADASEDGTGRGTPIVNTPLEGIGVRRLAPIETERLQGFPDDWTETGVNENDVEVPISDAQRYRQMGNSLAIPVFEDIAHRLVDADERYP